MFKKNEMMVDRFVSINSRHRYSYLYYEKNCSTQAITTSFNNYGVHRLYEFIYCISMAENNE